MSMRDQDQVNALQARDLIFALLKNRICQPRIDQKHVPGRRDDFECRLAIPGQLCFHPRHETEFHRASNNDE